MHFIVQNAPLFIPQNIFDKHYRITFANENMADEMLGRHYISFFSESKLSIILFDVDHFKEYNDYYGHVMGDECLRRVAAVLAGSGRSVDLAARYGGDEFACILPDTDLQSAVKIAEKIRQRIWDLKIEHKKSPVSEYVTASFGVTTAVYSPETTLEEIIATADELLYKAKASRNSIEFAELKNREAKTQICNKIMEFYISARQTSNPSWMFFFKYSAARL